MSRAMGRAASGFRPKLHNRAESLSFERLDIRSGKSRHESGGKTLDIPKFGRESLDMGRKGLVQTFATKFWYVQTFQPTRLMSRLFRLKLSARLCNLGLNRDAVRPSKSGPSKSGPSKSRPG